MANTETNDGPIQTLVQIGRAIENDDEYRRNMAQAEPAYYGILERHKYLCPRDYEDGLWVFNKNYEGPEDLQSAVCEYLTSEDADSDWDDSLLADDRDHQTRVKDAMAAINMTDGASEEQLLDMIKNSSFVAETIVETLNLGEVQAYQMVERLRTDSLALTHEGILETCRQNGHNFKKGYTTYAMTAIRSPEIRELKLALRSLSQLARVTSCHCKLCGGVSSISDIDVDDELVTLRFVCEDCGHIDERKFDEIVD